MSTVRGALTLAVGAVLFSCRGQVPLGGQDDGLTIGAACIPSQELSTTFLGFDPREVAVDEGNAACGSGVCLVNHYRGRVSCPYGQNVTATASYNAITSTHEPCKGTQPSDANSACCTPGSEKPVLASQDVGSATPTQSQVQPNCADRQSAKTVTCSCRCADAAGKTDDGAQYCSCPAGFTCAQVVPELTVGDPLAGAYCIANGSEYDPRTSCTGTTGCDPTTTTGQPSYCGPTNAAGTQPPANASAERTYSLTALQWATPAETMPRTCVPFAVPTDASGMANCVLLASLGSGQSCSGTAGLTVPDPAIVASAQQDLQLTMPESLCEVSQLAAPCETGTQPGWCYVGGANAPMGCVSAVDYSMGFPAGSFAILGCY